MKPNKEVIDGAMKGRSFILTRHGGWRIFKTQNWFKGESRFEIIGPNGKEWVVTVSDTDPRPIVLAAR